MRGEAQRTERAEEGRGRPRGIPKIERFRVEVSMEEANVSITM